MSDTTIEESAIVTTTTTGPMFMAAVPGAASDCVASSSVELKELRAGASPRLSGLDREHALTLAGSSTPLPPILVDRRTMRVIDGHHRVVAARIRGESCIPAVLFDGTEKEALVEAIRRNIAHGKPLSLNERRVAAERLLVLFVDWSDRAIAEVCGLSPKTVAAFRRRATEDYPQSRMRTGLDGRTRPVDATAARNGAAALLRQEPETSLRAIARRVGTSVGTVRDVRSRLSNGMSPTLPRHDPSIATGRVVGETGGSVALVNDNACCSTDAGAQFAIWFDSHPIAREDWVDLVDDLPLSRIYTIITAARARASAWEELAAALELRVRAETRRR